MSEQKYILRNIVDDSGDSVGQIEGVIHANAVTVSDWLLTAGVCQDAAGMVTGSRPLDEPRAVILNITVQEECQHQGLGQVALDNFIEQAVLEGVTQVIVHADMHGYLEEVADIVAWLKSCGFREVGTNVSPCLVLDIEPNMRSESIEGFSL